MIRYQQLDAKEAKLCWEQKEHNRKAEWINNIDKELQRLKKGSEAIIHLELLRATLKKEHKWEIPGHDGIQEF